MHCAATHPAPSILSRATPLACEDERQEHFLSGVKSFAANILQDNGFRIANTLQHNGFREDIMGFLGRGRRPAWRLTFLSTHAIPGR